MTPEATTGEHMAERLKRRHSPSECRGGYLLVDAALLDALRARDGRILVNRLPGTVPRIPGVQRREARARRLELIHEHDGRVDEFFQPFRCIDRDAPLWALVPFSTVLVAGFIQLWSVSPWALLLTPAIPVLALAHLFASALRTRCRLRRLRRDFRWAVAADRIDDETEGRRKAIAAFNLKREAVQ